MGGYKQAGAVNVDGGRDVVEGGSVTKKESRLLVVWQAINNI
jgi:hypothetical protein